MTRSSFARIIAAILVIAGAYVLARTTGWTGPMANVLLVDGIMLPAVILVTAWGLYRLAYGGAR